MVHLLDDSQFFQFGFRFGGREVAQNKLVWAVMVAGFLRLFLWGGFWPLVVVRLDTGTRSCIPQMSFQVVLSIFRDTCINFNLRHVFNHSSTSIFSSITRSLIAFLILRALTNTVIESIPPILVSRTDLPLIGDFERSLKLESEGPASCCLSEINRRQGFGRSSTRKLYATLWTE